MKTQHTSNNSNSNHKHNGDAAVGQPAPSTQYGSRVSTADAVELIAQPVKLPSINKDFIRSLAIAKGPSGEPDVRDYHKRLFNEQNSEPLARCQHLQKHLAGERRGIQRHLQELSDVIQHTERYQEVNDASVPWTTFDQIKVGVLGVVSVLLLLVGVNSIAQVLLASGIPGFESPLRTYLFSFVPVGLALLFEFPRTHLAKHESRQLYSWLVMFVALVFGVCWVCGFARTFPGMTQSVADLINSLGQPRRGEPDHSLIVVSILAETLLAASCWLTIETIVEKHDSLTRIENPAHARAQADLDEWQEHRFALEKVSAELHAKIQAIGEARLRFVEEAVGCFYLVVREVAQNGASSHAAADSQSNHQKQKGSVKGNHPTLRSLACLLFALGFHQAAVAASYIVGLSPNYSSPDRDVVFKEVLLFILETAVPGDQVTVYDGLSLQPVTKFALPQGALFEKNPRARVPRLQSEIAALKAFLSAERPHPPELAGALQVPGFLALAGSHLRRADERVHVILIGSPHFVSLEEPGFNTREAFPSDAHLAADPRDSVFGIASKRQALTGVSVHWAYFRDCFVNDFHKGRLGRFWSLFVRGQGGACSTFAPHVGLAFQRAKQGITEPFLRAEVDPNETKVEMRHVSLRATPVWFPPTNQVPARLPDTATSPVTQTSPRLSAASLPVAPRTGITGIGIMWSAPGCDFDLWVKPTPTARDLYFGHTQSPEGRYYHDYRDRNQGVDYEYVELKNPVDLRQVKAYVNFFKGAAANPSGLVVLHYGDRTYQASFTLRAPSGNQAAARDQRAQSPHWVEIDLMQLLQAAAATPNRPAPGDNTIQGGQGIP